MPFDPRKPVPVPQRRLVCLLLTFTGGFLDVYTYFTRGGVFANAQSGNMILMSIRFAQGDWAGGRGYLVPILAYMAGILTSGILRSLVGTRGNLHWRQPLVLIELILLFAVGFVPHDAHNGPVNLVVSFICAIQVSSFSHIEGLPFASTMCTGNLRSGVESLYGFILTREWLPLKNALQYFSVIGVFVASAFVGVFLIQALGERAIWVCCGVLLVVLVYLVRVQDAPKREG